MRDALLQSLAEFPDRLERALRAFPPHLLDWRPASWDGVPSERLTAIEQACHVRDIERDGYHVRLMRVLAEDCPDLPDIPGEQLAVERRYSSAGLQAVLADFRVARAQTIALLAGASDAHWARPALFEGQATTFGGLVHFLCSHDHQHLAGLHWLLGKHGVQPSAGMPPTHLSDR